jgi:dTDP-4-amino-4,6-dideoxygalactose transaminase
MTNSEEFAVSSIPLVDLSIQHREIAAEVELGFAEVLGKGDYIGGSSVSMFEREYAEYVGAAHCVGVANGTDALEMALRALGVGRDDEVVLPANTFIATAEAVVRAGAVPVLVDADDDALLIDPKQVEAALTARTKAVIPVDLYGQAAPFEQLPSVIAERGIAVLQDGAQSQGALRHGRPAGSFATIGATSFYPGKNLGAYGDAGAVITQDPELARRVRVMGAHGSAVKYKHTEFGFNSRLDTLQSVVLRAKLRRLEAWNGQRRAAAQRYDELLAGHDRVRPPVTLEGNQHVWHLYVIRVANRDEVLKRLNANGIGAGIHYPVPVHLQPAFAQLGQGAGSFPVTEASAREMISLPIFPGITPAQQERVVEVLSESLG